MKTIEQASDWLTEETTKLCSWELNYPIGESFVLAMQREGQLRQNTKEIGQAFVLEFPDLTDEQLQVVCLNACSRSTQQLADRGAYCGVNPEIFSWMFGSDEKPFRLKTLEVNG